VFKQPQEALYFSFVLCMLSW